MNLLDLMFEIKEKLVSSNIVQGKTTTANNEAKVMECTKSCKFLW